MPVTVEVSATGVIGWRDDDSNASASYASQYREDKN